MKQNISTEHWPFQGLELQGKMERQTKSNPKSVLSLVNQRPKFSNGAPSADPAQWHAQDRFGGDWGLQEQFRQYSVMK